MKIAFIPNNKVAAECLTPPLPAKKVIPEWFKETPFLLEGLNNYTTRYGHPPVTVKGCTPFLDSITSGYVYCLSSDLEIIRDNGVYSFHWRTERPVISEHAKEQHPLLPSAFNGQESVHKFENDFIIKTPKGYSTFFTHPLNRHDLPFRTFSGVVDTDTFMGPVNFPFQIIDINLTKDITILEKGTPICQFIPFKRDNWKHEVKPYDENLIRKEDFKYFSKIYRAYKSLHWIKKRYD